MAELYDLYLTVRKKSDNGDQALAMLNAALSMDLFDDLTASQTKDPLVSIRKNITKLRRREFSDISEDQSTLIQYHPLNATISPKIIADHESHIQALRYLLGMLLIALHVDSAKKKALLKAIVFSFNLYKQNKTQNGSAFSAYQLANHFSQILQRNFNISKNAASTQVTMARDLGILLEDHLDVCTITERETQVTIEHSQNIKISSDYYDREFRDLNNKVWFKDAKSIAGLKGENTWLENFFSSNLDALKEKGFSAPPSARWLPLPANCQKVITQVHQLDASRVLGDKIPFTETNVIRLGTLTAYELNDKEEQIRLAKEMLREILNQFVKSQIESYRNEYSECIAQPFTYFVSYQTLLTPHFLEAYLFHFKNIIPLFRDNNAIFVDVTAQVMNELKDEYKISGVDLQFVHSNSAVNDRAGWFTARNSNTYHAVRETKLKATAALLKTIATHELFFPSQTKSAVGLASDCLLEVAAYLEGGSKFTPNIAIKMELLAQTLKSGELMPDKNIALQNEIAQRLSASFHLRRLIDGSQHYENLPRYQRNIMMAALEAQVLGKQATNIIGCKSTRDRTGYVLGAIRGQLEDPKALYRWQNLYDGVKRSLTEGHYFRSMIHHVVVIKEVAKIFMQGLDRITQASIARVTVFSKAIGHFSTNMAQKLIQKKSFRSSTASTASLAVKKPIIVDDLHESSIVEVKGVRSPLGILGNSSAQVSILGFKGSRARQKLPIIDSLENKTLNNGMRQSTIK